MVIDSHQHFWKYAPVRDSWITEDMERIRRDFLPSDLQPVLKKNAIDGCIAIQADQSEEENLFLLKLAEKNNFIKGVIGWVDLCSDSANYRLQYFSQFKAFRGVRHIVQAEPDGFMLKKDFQNGIKTLSKYKLTYDILINYKQLSEVVILVEKFPNQPFVLDHLGKPPIASKEMDTWEKQIDALSKFQNVHCKVSGMVTEADWNHWKPSDFTLYLDVVFKTFGSKRILYGSDWPVCLLASEYNEQLQVVKDYVSQFSSEEKTAIMGGNAIQFYNIK